MAGQECTVEAEKRSQGDTEYVCTPDDNGDLVWMDKDSSEKLLEERQLAEAQRQAEEAAAREEAERQAAEVTRQQQPADDFTYPNCTAVKEAGAAPIHPGDYGWHSGLDRDGDGVGVRIRRVAGHTCAGPADPVDQASSLISRARPATDTESGQEECPHA